ncbi:hypothetical protein SBRCBS47491_004260 [Sporothrix bragantina]|uniref:Xaa-Pro dipeptidyl-peptidase C-terminal domain-containing protein n=1 Tax=Sporothrix bragantina TaxID=671064 RepID=A0ABP0BMI2_9PEZI
MKAGDIEIKFCDKQDKISGNKFYPGFKPGTEVLKQGTVVREGALALPCSIIKDRDVGVQLRDGTTIYVDILRPAEGTKFPALITWSPFGKNGGLTRMGINRSPWRRGIPQRSVSGLEVFEGPDPAYWCNHGYAMVHADIRGTWMSEGNMMMNNVQEGRDGYDLVEWVAKQPWSNERVTIAGNSWLTQAQWFIAAENPPHLTCICPYEGWNDMYNDTTNRGGIPDPGFQAIPMLKACAGNQLIEDVGAMSREHTMWNEYYEQRKAKLDRITVPMYVTASWTNFLHTRGTMRGWIETTQVKEKWLRVHNSNEWPDLYYPENVEDYRKFCDYYMKGKSNGWEFTPAVRLSILNPGHSDIVNRPTPGFPIPSQKSVSMFLDAKHNGLSWSGQQAQETSIVTIAGTGGVATFVHTFSSRVELTGFFALKIYVSSATNAKDIDIFCKTSKLSANGELLESCCVDVGYLAADPEKERADLSRLHREKHASIDSVWFAEGTTGRLRASHRELDTTASTPHWPRYTHSNYQPLSAGEVVPLVIELWPLGMIWEAGEKLQLSIAGHNLRPEGLSMLPPVQTCNASNSLINIHTGGQYDSHLLVPYIPEI